MMINLYIINDEDLLSQNLIKELVTRETFLKFRDKSKKVVQFSIDNN